MSEIEWTRHRDKKCKNLHRTKLQPNCKFRWCQSFYEMNGNRALSKDSSGIEFYIFHPRLTLRCRLEHSWWLTLFLFLWIWLFSWLFDSIRFFYSQTRAFRMLSKDYPLNYFYSWSQVFCKNLLNFDNNPLKIKISIEINLKIM